MRLVFGTFVFAVFLAGCGGSSHADQSAKIQAALGNTASCSATGFAIISRLDKSETPIYDCYVGASAKRMCVVEENDLIQDRTAEVRLLYAGTLAGGKPACLNHA
jgi:hypothetical protein